MAAKKPLFNRQMRRISELDANIQAGLAREEAERAKQAEAEIETVDYTPEQIAALDPALFEPAGFNEEDAERTGYSNYSYWASTFKNFWRNKVARVLIIALIAVLLFAFLQPIFPGQHDPVTINNDPETGIQLMNLAPSSEYWFGTNAIGQDLWARVWAGTRVSVFIGLVVALSDLVVGVIIGMIWGYVRKVDKVMTEIYNVISNVPQTLILILVSYILRPSITTIIISMCMVGWMAMARFIRNQVVIFRDRDFNLASRCLGTSTFRIITKNLLPQMVSVIMLQTALAIPGAIGDEVFLTYIGLGLPTSQASLGNLVEAGRVLMMQKELRYQLIFPRLSLHSSRLHSISSATRSPMLPTRKTTCKGERLWKTGKSFFRSKT